jgi:hypothetical protein
MALKNRESLANNIDDTCNRRNTTPSLSVPPVVTPLLVTRDDDDDDDEANDGNCDPPDVVFSASLLPLTDVFGKRDGNITDGGNTSSPASISASSSDVIRFDDNIDDAKDDLPIPLLPPPPPLAAVSSDVNEVNCEVVEDDI